MSWKNLFHKTPHYLALLIKIVALALRLNLFLQGSLDSVAMTNLSGPYPSGDGSRGYNLYGWMWWKPQEDFVCQPPPPSYDETVANDR